MPQNFQTSSDIISKSNDDEDGEFVLLKGHEENWYTHPMITIQLLLCYCIHTCSLQVLWFQFAPYMEHPTTDATDTPVNSYHIRT